MFDMSCRKGSVAFGTIQTDAFKEWAAIKSSDPMDPELVQVMRQQNAVIDNGDYFFIAQNGKLNPVLDERSTGQFKGNPDAIVVAQQVKSIPSPDGPENVDWVELKKVSGGLTKQIIIVETVKGQPPSTVSPTLNLCLCYSINLYIFGSAPLAVLQPSNLRRNSVRVHDLTIVAWLSHLLTCVYLVAY
jgi:hypothetical protein